MPELTDVFKALEGLENGLDLKGAILTAIEAEKTTGIEAHRKVNKEAEALRVHKKALETAGYTAESGDPQEWLAKILAENAKGKDSGKKLTDAEQKYNEVTERLLKSEKTIADITAKSEATERALAEKTILGEVTKLAGGKIAAIDIVAKSFLSEGKLSLKDGEPVYHNDGVDFGLDKFLEFVKAERPELILNDQAGGAGSGGSGGADNSDGRKDADTLNWVRSIGRKTF